MDTESLDIVKRVWKHSGLSGRVWVPHIVNIGDKQGQRFREGAALDPRKPVFPDLRDSVDWYWTPAVSSSDSRKAGEYSDQRVVWLDCDDSFDDKLLTFLKPSFLWETSPGHKQAVWLLKEKLSPAEFHRDGFLGMLTHAVGGDKSGVDIGQLLRFPGTWHHKREAFQGRVLRSSGQVFTRSQLLSRVAKGLGFAPGLASELAAADPYGDRSKLLWKFSRSAAELGLSEELTFKLIKATQWNKWKDEPEKLREDIAKAYSQQAPPKPTKVAKDSQEASEDDEGETPTGPWELSSVRDFGEVLRRPLNWIVPSIIPEGGCGLLVAAPKVGKTRIAIEVALGVATGKMPLGLSVKKPQPVGFLSLEDGEYLFSLRLNDSLNRDRGRFRYHWDGHIRKDLTWEPPISMPLFTAFDQVDLSAPEDQARLMETILQYGLKLVVIDTLSMAIGKSDVSNSKDMYAILKGLKTIAKETKCAIMFIHHTRKRVFEKGESIQEMVLGSTALHAWSDFILNLVSPEEGTDLLRLGVQTKMGNNTHHITQELKIIKVPPREEE